jgi:ribosome-associated protein
MIDDPAYDDRPEKPSKTQRKRDMDALQTLGETLLTFNPQKLGTLNLPDDLMAALVEAKRIPEGRKAARRHHQYIGKIMRGLNPETLDEIRRYLAKRGK